MLGKARVLDVVLLVMFLSSAGFALSRRGGSPTATTIVTAGDTLANIRLLAQAGVASLPESGLAEIVGEGDASCAAVVFFNPRCQFCEQMAPAWAGLDQLPGGTVASVVWVSVAPQLLEENDEFMRRHSLGERWYAIPDRRSGASIGIDRWPLVYMLDSRRVLQGFLSRDPVDASAEIGPGCEYLGDVTELERPG